MWVSYSRVHLDMPQVFLVFRSGPGAGFIHWHSTSVSDQRVIRLAHTHSASEALPGFLATALSALLGNTWPACTGDQHVRYHAQFSEAAWPCPAAVLHLARPVETGVSRVVTDLVRAQGPEGLTVHPAGPPRGTLPTTAARTGAQAHSRQAERQTGARLVGEASVAAARPRSGAVRPVPMTVAGGGRRRLGSARSTYVTSTTDAASRRRRQWSWWVAPGWEANS